MLVVLILLSASGLDKLMEDDDELNDKMAFSQESMGIYTSFFRSCCSLCWSIVASEAKPEKPRKP